MPSFQIQVSGSDLEAAADSLSNAGISVDRNAEQTRIEGSESAPSAPGLLRMTIEAADVEEARSRVVDSVGSGYDVQAGPAAD